MAYQKNKLNCLYIKYLIVEKLLLYEHNGRQNVVVFGIDFAWI